MHNGRAMEVARREMKKLERTIDELYDLDGVWERIQRRSKPIVL